MFNFIFSTLYRALLLTFDILENLPFALQILIVYTSKSEILLVEIF